MNQTLKKALYMATDFDVREVLLQDESGIELPIKYAQTSWMKYQWKYSTFKNDALVLEHF